MLKKIRNSALIALFALCLITMTSCSEPVTVDQSITPHDAALKALSALGYTENDLAEFADAESETGGKKIIEYYSEGSESYVFDDVLFEIQLSATADDSLKLSMVEQYSIMMFDKDLPTPFELVIYKFPKTDGKVDSALISKAKKLCTDNLNQYKRSMQDYLSEFIPYAENAKVKVTDNFVYYCMAENTSAVTTVIENYLSGK